MDFIDKQDAVGILLKLFQQRLKPFFKIAAVFGARQQRTDIQRVNGAIGHHFRHIALHDTPGQPFGNRRFADAGFPHQQRVIFTATTQDLDRAFQFFFTTNQRIDAAHASKLVKIRREVFHTFLPASLFVASWLIAEIGRLARFVFSRPVRNKVHDIQTAHFMLTQQISRL